MNVYLVQHAEAMSEQEDASRPLAKIGRRHAEDVASAAAKLGVEVMEIRHSDKIRAMQTAEILGEALAPKKGVVKVSGLAPLDDVVPVAAELNDRDQPVMLVGHLPFMERIAGYLLTGDADQPVIDFTNAAIVCLEKREERWQVTWILTPEIAALWR